MAYFELPLSIRMSSSDPIDGDRYIAQNLAARDAIIVDGRAHEGLQVYVVDEKNLYILKDLAESRWEQISDTSSLLQYIDGSLNTINNYLNILDASIERIDTSLNESIDGNLLFVQNSSIGAPVLHTVYWNNGYLEASINAITPTIIQYIDGSLVIIENHLTSLDASIERLDACINSIAGGSGVSYLSSLLDVSIGSDISAGYVLVYDPSENDASMWIAKKPINAAEIFVTNASLSGDFTWNAGYLEVIVDSSGSSGGGIDVYGTPQQHQVVMWHDASTVTSLNGFNTEQVVGGDFVLHAPFGYIMVGDYDKKNTAIPSSDMFALGTLQGDTSYNNGTYLRLESGTGWWEGGLAGGVILRVGDSYGVGKAQELSIEGGNSEGGDGGDIVVRAGTAYTDNISTVGGDLWLGSGYAYSSNGNTLYSIGNIYFANNYEIGGCLPIADSSDLYAVTYDPSSGKLSYAQMTDVSSSESTSTLSGSGEATKITVWSDSSTLTSDSSAWINSTGLTATNIRATNFIWKYVISDDILLNHSAEATTQSLEFVKLKTITLGDNLDLNTTLRIKFDLTIDVSDGPAGRAYIARNGTQVGTLQFDTTGVYQTFSEDISSWNSGDACELWATVYDENPGPTTYVKNFMVCGTHVSAIVNEVTGAFS